MPSTRRVALPLLVVLSTISPAGAEAMRVAAVGCRTASDASTLTPGGTAAKLADGTCMTFRKNLVVDIDERKPPLACVRLTGDLSCWWMSASSIDDHPGEKGGGAGRKAGGGRRH